MHTYSNQYTFADRDTIIFKDSHVTSLDRTMCWVASLISVTGFQVQVLGQTGFCMRGREVQVAIPIKSEIRVRF